MRTNKMKNTVLAVCTLLLTPFLGAFGAADDTLIAFGTRGPDTYLDGTTVKDGECYALVWTRAGATFAGLAADGTAIGEDSKVVVFAPIAKGGRCPRTLFQLDKALAKQFAGGAFELYLVDTRLANGKLGGVNAMGVPVAVNGFGALSEGMVANGETEPTVAVTTRSEVPAGTPQPTITAIRIVGDNVYLTVKNTVPCLQYAAQEVKVGGEGEGEGGVFSAATQGDADGEITVIAPKKGNSGFFSVGRK